MALGEKSEDERSLRDDLAAGLKEIEERESAAPEGDDASAPEAEAKVEPAETQTDRGDGRDAHGRFLPKSGSQKDEAAKEPKPSEDVAPLEQPGQTEQASAPPSPEATTDQPPKSWRSDEASAWKDLPATAKAAIVRREAEAARLAGANDGERMFGREFAEIIRPHMPTIQQFGVTPQQAVKALLDSDQALRSSTPEQKLAHARKLCFDYGIDVTQLAQPDPNAPSDPFVVQLQNELQQLKSRLGQQGQPQQFSPLPPSQDESIVLSEIEAFRSDPAHPHFDAVHQTMGQLLETGQAPDLESAYQAAVTLNPALRSTATAPVAAANSAEKTAAARRASASVASSPGPTGNPIPMSLRDELREQMRSAGFSV